jgi:hypothetical protein
VVTLGNKNLTVQLVQCLNHIPKKIVDFDLSASKISTFDEVVGLLSPATSGRVQFERPQEVGSILEIGSNCHYFMYQVFYANNSKFAKSSFNYIIACDWSTLAINLDESSFVD